MKELLPVILFLLAGAVPAQAQTTSSRSYDGTVEVRREKQGDNETLFTAIKNAPGYYTISVEFYTNSLRENVFMVLRDIQTDVKRYNGVSPGFRFTYYPGMVNGRVRLDHVYRLPFEEGEERSVRLFHYDAGSRTGNNEIMDHISYIFTASENDYVYAIRKGIVSRIEDTQWFVRGVADDKVLRRANKQITVQHEDGTNSYYTGVQEGTITVREGDLVYPDTRLGKAGTLDGIHYEIRVSLDYLTVPAIGHNIDFKQVKRNLINPFFLTPDGPVQVEEGMKYECVVTHDLITKEMNKREKKGVKKK